jgi:hypothetical protein
MEESAGETMSGETAKERAVAEIMNRDFGCDPPTNAIANAAYDAGREQGIEDAAKIAENCQCDHLATHGSMRQMIAYQIRKLKDGKG